MCIAMKNRVGQNTSFRSRRVRASMALASAIAGIAPFWLQSAHGSTFTWDTVTGDGAAITPGSGTWNTTNTNWNSAEIGRAHV